MNATRDDYRTIDELYMSLGRVLGRAYPAMLRDDIEEAVQHAMNVYCAGVPEHVKSDPARLFRWLRTIARRMLHREAVRRRRRPTFGDEGEIGEIAPSEPGAETTRLACSWSATRILHILTPLTARIIWLHDIDGWKPSEIAKEIGCSINSINHRVKRGHTLLRRVLRDERRFLLWFLIAPSIAGLS